MSFLFKSLKDNKVYVVIFALLFIFFILAPMSGDDYRWAFQYLTFKDQGDLLSYVPIMYKGTNGRIIGNALEFFLINYPILASIIKSTVMLGIVYAFSKITKIKKPIAISLVALLIFLPPVSVFRQAIIWSAGFYNYTVPILLLMTIYLIIVGRRKNKYIYSILFLLSVAVSLFAENITLINLVLIFTYGAAQLLLYRRVDSRILVSAAGLLLGALLMFGSPVYLDIASGSDGYREVSTMSADILNQLAVSANKISIYLIFNMLHLYTILLIAFGALLYKSKNKNTNHSANLIISAISLALLWFVSGLQSGNGLKTGYMITLITWLFFILFLAGLFNCITKITINKTAKTEIIGFTTAGILYVAPFLLVSPFGPRNFYITYIFIAMSIVSSLRLIFYRVKFPPIDKRTVYVFVAIITAILIGFMALLRITYSDNEKQIKKQLSEGKTTVYIKSYSIGGLVHDSQSAEKQAPYIIKKYCTYENCNDDMKIKIIYQ